MCSVRRLVIKTYLEQHLAFKVESNFEDLAADASDVAVGAELSQNGQLVASYSKKLTPIEARYYVTDRELLAIYQACKKRR